MPQVRRIAAETSRLTPPGSAGSSHIGETGYSGLQIYDYACDSETCKSFAPTETFDGFLNYNSRMTNRLEDFACVLAIETSCEASARIMKSMNIKISGDTVIRLLLKRYSANQSKQAVLSLE